MKPTLHFNSKRNDAQRRFPVTDFNYQSVELGSYNGRCAELAGDSFRTTREYFDHEAARDFLTEAAVFGVIMLSVAAPLLNGIESIAHLLRVAI